MYKGYLASAYDNSSGDAKKALIALSEQIKNPDDLKQEMGSIAYIREEEAKRKVPVIKKEKVKKKKK